jgi:hypothetical protein
MGRLGYDDIKFSDTGRSGSTAAAIVSYEATTAAVVVSDETALVKSTPAN